MKKVALFVATMVAILVPTLTFAQTHPIERGLTITPPRQYLEADPGKSAKSSVVIANLTKNDVTATLSVQQFSVADYTYDYTFHTPEEDWLRLKTTMVSLKKTESRTIGYELAIPKNAIPGGRYFTVFASVSPQEGKVVQVATVIYVSVNGKLVTTSKAEKNSTPIISFGGDIPFAMDIRNTGNTHFFVYLSGKLNGLSAQPPQTEIAHLLLPQTVRSVEGKITSPLIPGIYQAEYGFKAEDGRRTTYQSLIIYAPPWFWALLIGAVWFVVAWHKRRRRLGSRLPTDS